MLQRVQRTHTSAGESATPSDSRPSWVQERDMTNATLPSKHAIHSLETRRMTRDRRPKNQRG